MDVILLGVRANSDQSDRAGIRRSSCIHGNLTHPTHAGPQPMTDAAPFPPDDDERAPVPLIVPGILLLVAIGGVVDLVSDRPSSWLSFHVIAEVLLLGTSLTFSVVLWRGWWRTSRRLASAQRSLALKQEERDAWQRSAESALAGFGEAVDRQFATWNLTPAEREVALLLLKGHGHKQIAARTGRSERTVRQHAVSVYQKSGLGGRAELAAFFLEGLMINPSRGSDVPRPSPP
jgi:DNA-binding CsgD family transcriptional regulator